MSTKSVAFAIALLAACGPSDRSRPNGNGNGPDGGGGSGGGSNQDGCSQAAMLVYTVDENNAEWTVPHLEAFLDDIRDVAARSGAHSIYLIAHSMGNRPLTWALQRIAAKLGAGARPPFQEILLTAPDIDAGVFAELAQQLRRAADRVTLYASSKDRALTASKKINGYPRAGDSDPEVVVLPDIDTVDVSELDTDLVGHFYYGDNCSVLSDIAKLLHDHAAAAQRGLARKLQKDLPYWVAHRGAGCP